MEVKASGNVLNSAWKGQQQVFYQQVAFPEIQVKIETALHQDADNLFNEYRTHFLISLFILSARIVETLEKGPKTRGLRYDPK